MKWWCRISMQVSAESTDDAVAHLKGIMPELAEAVATELGIQVRRVAIDNWVVIPYIQKDKE